MHGQLLLAAAAAVQGPLQGISSSSISSSIIGSSW
jgi:hypothetical protein